MKDASELLRHIGEPYEEADCWEFIRKCYREIDVELPENYYHAINLFRVVSHPEPWDIISIRNHPILALHVGIYVEGDRFLHTQQDTGVSCDWITRKPWSTRIVGYLRLKNE